MHALQRWRVSRVGVLGFAAVAAAALLRTSWVLLTPSELIAGLDMRYYYSAAANLAAGDGLTVQFALGVGETPGPDGAQALIFPPGYPLALGAAFATFGTSVGTGQALNVAAGSLTVIVAFLLNRSVFGGPVAVISAFMLALYPAHVFWTSVLYSETLFTLLFTVACLAMWSALERPSTRTFMAFGVAAGAATVVRAPAIVLVPAMMILLWKTPPPNSILRHVTAAFLGIAAVLVPVAVWNTARAEHVVIVSENFGYNLRAGHSETANGRYTLPPEASRRGTPPDEMDFVRAAATYAVTHPADEVVLSLKKAYFLFVASDSDVLGLATTAGSTPFADSPGSTSTLGRIADAASVTLLLLTVAGIVVAPPRQRWFCGTILAVWLATHILFFGEPRFRLPLVPLMCGLASLAIVQFASALRRD